MYAYVLAAAIAALILATRLAPVRMLALGLALERRISGLTLKSAHVDGFDMPYLEGGQGEVLVLIHGFGGDKDNFTRIARFLTPHYRVLIPDQPGFGGSTRRADASYSMNDQTDRIAAFMKQLGLGRVHLGGNSFGGFIAALHAARSPELVASLWLLNPAGTAASYSSAVIRHYEETGENPLLVKTVADFDEAVRVTTHKAPFLPGFARKALALRAVADFPLHTRIAHGLHESPLMETTYDTLATPALIVWGAQDELLSPAGAEAYRKLFPNSQVNIMQGIGHLPMAEAPRQAAGDYLAYRKTI
ncbi:MAG: alpha/beta hydrolase [Telluria sp.]|nr:alpha/beta hydrolase [Telluria sp.]